ncbi:MAG: hypothetical protein Q7J43_15625 [Pseudomonas sp.]|uniref:hypothetical protein n=1 Tax=unclassified Pseudomonas TaxID=196821 RepID=UPI000CB00169|nr:MULTISPECIES: hypothetical protein [unclassified Pseudomonas]PKM26751.1 MAG: hypothetical protein CVV09_05125 [Gammaproteobacteria bacterium HGW-Gammaproteobacteria-13]MDF3196030.1 hypothetical protein [Pseudomonas sp. 1928-m]MDO9619095.1 hypothetical protein [Pseudomonas sp.]MDP2446639.1 hypothetical protein [Pseudomonas sp.]MDZ4332514.1 hypothetical protein [Pseudomonas sp.]
MRKLWSKYLALLDADLSAKIFDNIKNLLVCALLFAAGTDALHGNHQIFMGLWGSTLAGWGLIIVSALLLLLNISDALRRLAKLRHHVVLQLILFLLYLILAVRVVEIVWSFRST